MSSAVAIDLVSDRIAEPRAVLASFRGLTASTFRYSTGVAALRITNEVGWVDLLPFQGQQIWDAQFLGRRLTMRSIFSEPYPDAEYLNSYGAFLIHCGATSMGHPGIGDDHPLHGELPNARYLSAQLLVGTDESGAYMALTGTYQHRVAFTHHYRAQPKVIVRAASGRLHLDLRIENLRRSPMELMYLAHINFLPVDGGELIDSGSQMAPTHKAVLDYGRNVDPELVMQLDCAADQNGWAHAMQRHPDGSADFVSHRPDQLDHALRWVVRNGDEEALGLALPATAGAAGYTQEKAIGNVKTLDAGGRFRCAVDFGVLNPSEADTHLRRIAQPSADHPS